MGGYLAGKSYVTDLYRCFHTNTHNNMSLTFILPENGHTVEEVFTHSTLSEISNISYVFRNEEMREEYYTRCLFPEFSAQSDIKGKSIMQSNFGITSMFDSDESRFSEFTSNAAFASDICQITNLTVNRSGIEGAAITYMPTTPPPLCSLPTQKYTKTSF